MKRGADGLRDHLGLKSNSIVSEALANTIGNARCRYGSQMTEPFIKPADTFARDRRIDCICDEFEAAWLAGQSPKLQEYLDRAAEENRAALARELIPLDIHYRERRGERVDVSEKHELPKESGGNLPLNVGARPLSQLVGNTHSPTMTSFGTYEVLQEIARGGMGIVFKGRDTDLRRDVAVKVLLEDHQGEAELIKRFVEEARISGQLQHPGITPIYELGESADGRPYFAMKLVNGETLARLLGARTNPQEGCERFLKIFEQICQTMAYAHSRGVIHRDLKPANIMVGAFGEVQVMDWGLAKVLAEGSASQMAHPDNDLIHTIRSVDVDDSAAVGPHTRCGSVLGTLAYMSPEQAMGRIDQIDQRTDVFGLGAILCEVLTGRPPYVAPNSEELRRKVARAELSEAFDRLDRCGADKELIGLAQRTLASKPAERPADAGVLAIELVKYRERVETRLRDAELAGAQATTRVVEAQTRRKLTMIFSGAVLAVLAIGVIGTTWGLLRTGRALDAEAEQRRLADKSARIANAAATAESQAKKRLRRELYVSDLQLASQMWGSSEGTANHVSKLLMGQIPVDGQPDLREFAWRLQWTALNRNSRILKGHAQGARLAAFTPDGDLLTLDGELTLRRWKLPEGICIGEPTRLDVSRASVWSISADAQRIALGCDNLIQVFDTQTGKKVTLTGRSLVLGLSFSADGRNLAAAWGDGRVQVWDTATGQATNDLVVQNPKQIHLLQRIELAPDAQSLYLLNYPDDSQVTRLGVDQSELLCATEHRSTVYSMALTSDGTWRATGDANGQVYLSKNATPNEEGLSLRAHRGVVSALGFSANGRRLATGGADGIVTVWDVAGRKPLHSFKGHLGLVHTVSFAPDGVTVTSASEDDTTRIWDRLSDHASRVFGVHEHPVFSMAYSPDGKRLAIGTGSSSNSPGSIVKIWEVPSGKLLKAFRAADGRVLSMAYSTDGRWLITGGYEAHLRVWDAETGSEHLDVPVKDLPTYFRQSAIGTMAVSPCGRFVAAGFGHPTFHQSDYEQVAKVWELGTGRELATLHGHSNTICDVAFSRDGKLLATASDDHQVKLWSTENWEPLDVGTLRGAERMKCVTFSSDDQWIVAGDFNGAVTIWETASGRRVNELRGHTDLVQRLVFSADGRTLATASWDNTVKLWDPLSGREIRTLRDHKDWISCLAFAPDGNTLATGSFDAKVRLWEAATASDISATVADDRAMAEAQQTRRRDEMQERMARASLSIAGQQLEVYSGDYQNGVSIAHEADHLTIRPVEGEAGAPVKLYPTSQKEFFARDCNLDVTFLKDDEGQVVSALIYRNGDAYEVRRTTRPPNSSDRTPGPR
jgi:WD40 repeat protein/serine/threonine protein kinase